jgi:hypothetical protein
MNFVDVNCISFAIKGTTKSKGMKSTTLQLTNDPYICTWILMCNYNPTIENFFATRYMAIGSNVIVPISMYNYRAIHLLIIMMVISHQKTKKQLI